MPFSGFKKILSPLYQGKDPCHGIGHIERIHAKALRFSKGRKADMEALSLGACLHGLIKEQKAQAQGLLLMAGTSATLLEKAMRIAEESQASAVPGSIEGKILHDAHLCEGGDDFLAVKSFVTSAFRGYPLDQTYAWVNENMLEGGERRCYTREGKAEYARKLKRLKGIWKELGEILGCSC